MIGLVQSRGGGLYALGYVVTFVLMEVLEIPDLVSDLAGLFGGDGTFPGSLFALGVEFFVDTLRNMVYGFIWPALLIREFGWMGVAAVAVGFATYDSVLRPIVERFVPELKPKPEEDEEQDEPRS